MKTYRVVQWATGNIGTRSLRSVIEHPTLELAGVYVHSPDQGGPRTRRAVRARPHRRGGHQRHRRRSWPWAPTACSTCPALDADEVCRLLAAGTNVVTTRGEFHHPAEHGPGAAGAGRGRLRPGRPVDPQHGEQPRVHLRGGPARADVDPAAARRPDDRRVRRPRQRDSPALLFEIMGFGKPPAAFDERRLSHGRTSFGPSLRLVADALALPLDDVEASGEVAVASRTVEIAAGTLEAGTVAAQRLTVAGMRDGRPLLRFRASWYCTTDLDPAWDVRPTGVAHRSRATPRSTSTCASRCRSSGWATSRPATPPTGRSTPCPSCRAPPRASAPRSTSPR